MITGSLALLPGCTIDLGIEADNSFDEVLNLLHTTAPEFNGGLANHAPMALEALDQLGHSGRVAAWADGYSESLDLMDPGTALSTAEQTDALGDIDRVADWIATMQAELDADDPQVVLDRWFSILAPGWVGRPWPRRTL